MSSVEGTYRPAARVLHFRFLHAPAAPNRVLVDGNTIPPSDAVRFTPALSTWLYSSTDKCTDLYLENLPIARRIELTYEH